MEKNAHYFIVGIFVSLALVGMLSFIIWLAGTHDDRHVNNYTIYFTDSVSGLNEGAAVQYKGVQVGKVKDIRLADDRNDLIKVDIEVKDTTPIHLSTTASLATLGVTGLVYIQLTTTLQKDDDAPLRLEGERYPVIKGSGSALSKLLESVPQINKRITEITTKIDNLLTPENMQKLDAILANIQAVSGNVNNLLSENNVANMTTAMQNMADASQQFMPMINNISQTTTHFNATVGKFENIMEKNQGNISKFADEGLRQITATSRDAQDMTRSFRDLSDKLKQNPSQIIYKPSYHGVEVRK